MIHPNATYVRPMKRTEKHFEEECVCVWSVTAHADADQGYYGYASSVLMLFLNVATFILQRSWV